MTYRTEYIISYQLPMYYWLIYITLVWLLEPVTLVLEPCSYILKYLIYPTLVTIGYRTLILLLLVTIVTLYLLSLVSYHYDRLWTYTLISYLIVP